MIVRGDLVQAGLLLKFLSFLKGTEKFKKNRLYIVKIVRGDNCLIKYKGESHYLPSRFFKKVGSINIKNY